MNELQISCGRRVVRINNKNPNGEHVKTLIQYINEVSQDGNSCFSNDFHSCHEIVLDRCADLNRYDGMLVHEQVKIFLKEIKTMIEGEKERQKMEREKRERKKQIQKILAAFVCTCLSVGVVKATGTAGAVVFVGRKLFFKR
jgi:hypothetical protein